MTQPAETPASQPINEADRQARAAVRGYMEWLRRNETDLDLTIEVSADTLARLENGQRDVPPDIARELATLIRRDMMTAYERMSLEGFAMALEIWVEDCEERAERKEAPDNA
ncbi:MAG: hypothetical protein AAF687_13895 [Pseudomonadota bacterium]